MSLLCALTLATFVLPNPAGFLLDGIEYPYAFRLAGVLRGNFFGLSRAETLRVGVRFTCSASPRKCSSASMTGSEVDEGALAIKAEVLLLRGR